MYNVNDEKIVMSIAEVRALLDNPDYGLGYVDKSYVLPWIHPKNITGLDVENLVRVNRMRNYQFWTGDVPGADYETVTSDDYEGDDDFLRLYLSIVRDQRNVLSKECPDVEAISGERHFAALFYMAVHWQSYLNSGSVDPFSLTLDGLLACLDLYESAFKEIPECYLKYALLGTMDLFFCNSPICGEIVVLKEHQRFLADQKNIDRLEQLERLFERSCPEMVEMIAKWDAEAAEASAVELQPNLTT